ncbi:type IX secretion system periplasmic lipoprotein PorW/SprE [Flavobacterium columnare]|uniref:type IX secretion system periplasmic lipoprotein PorW/SprE n=1 Tax=Flavobacterium columnare TaxID=996 RepID=UPI004034A848
MKNYLIYIASFGLCAFVIACSTKKDTLIYRNWHALNSKYNTVYNGEVALQSGIDGLKNAYVDDFWEILPVERMQIEEESFLPGQKGKNANFSRAEDKAIKAIQKHSMNIEGRERNSQMDEAHLLLGKARYYDKRFVPALEAFNYILYKYSNSDKIYEAKVWREKTNVRLENDALAVKNLTLLLKRHDLPPHIKADGNALLTQAYINLEEKQKAVNSIKKSIEYTSNKEEKARYRFILGQLYEQLKYKDSASIAFQEVINMKRQSPRIYVIQAHAKQAGLIDVTKDTLIFTKKYAKLLKDRENRSYLDVLNHQVALFYDQLKLQEKAKNYYKKSLKSTSSDSYLMASNYRNLAKIYFDQTKYEIAGKYYDSTLTKFTKKNREYFIIEKKRKNLDEVIKYEKIAKHNDSIINLITMSDQERIFYFQKFIKELKKKDSLQVALDQKKQVIEQNREQNNQQNDNVFFDPNIVPTPGGKRGITPLGLDESKNSFYFYNPSTVAYGKVEFTKKWGKRALVDNWKWSAEIQNQKNEEVNPVNLEVSKNQSETVTINEKYTPEFYLVKLPTSKTVIDSLTKERNNAYYNLGVIYKEKFFENKVAEERFEQLLANKPEERFILPAKYNLFRLYEISDPEKAQKLKADIIANYPNTRYAQLVNGQISENKDPEAPLQVYQNCHVMFENQEYKVALDKIDKSMTLFSGDPLLPKFELLKALLNGKILGLNAYREGVQKVINTYPDTDEATKAEEILRIDIPKMEQMVLSADTTSVKWKVLYKVGAKEDKNTKILIDKLEKYIKEKQYYKFFVSYDIYNQTDNFVVIHGISSREYARFLVELLAKTKGYEVKENAIVISSQNYSVIQMKKNLNEYLQLKL